MKKYVLIALLLLSSVWCYSTSEVRHLNVSVDNPVYLEVSTLHKKPFSAKAVSFEDGDIFMEFSSPEGGFFTADDKEDPGEIDKETFFGYDPAEGNWLMKLGLRDDPADASKSEVVLELDKASVLPLEKKEWRRKTDLRGLKEPEAMIEVNLTVGFGDSALSNVSIFLDNEFVGTTDSTGSKTALLACDQEHAIKLMKQDYETRLTQFSLKCFEEEKRFSLSKKDRFAEETESSPVSERIEGRKSVLNWIKSFFTDLLGF